MRKSSIAKVRWQGKSGFARRVGWQLRRLRVERGLTQAQVAPPFTVGYVSAVETGAVVPSLPSLIVILRNLDVPLSAFFAAVEQVDAVQGETPLSLAR